MNGRILRYRPKSAAAREVASGASLVVDVEFGPGHRLYALSQGYFPPGNPEGSPALANTGALLRVGHAGLLKSVVQDLNQPTSVEFIGNTAYVVSLAGEIWRIEGLVDRRDDEGDEDGDDGGDDGGDDDFD